MVVNMASLLSMLVAVAGAMVILGRWTDWRCARASPAQTTTVPRITQILALNFVAIF
jgi:hypothetical protein